MGLLLCCLDHPFIRTYLWTYPKDYLWCFCWVLDCVVMMHNSDHVSRLCVDVLSNLLTVTLVVGHVEWEVINSDSCRAVTWQTLQLLQIASALCEIATYWLLLTLWCVDWQSSAALTLCQQLAVAMGPSIKQYVRVLGPSIISNFGDSKVSAHLTRVMAVIYKTS